MKKSKLKTCGALSSEEMRALENAAFESGKKDSFQLMEIAGNGVAEAIVQMLETHACEDWKVVVFCGPGNNGGDGFVVARLLADHGLPVQAFFYGRAEALSQDARRNYDRWTELKGANPYQLGFPQMTEGDFFALKQALETDRPLVIVDALFGIGLTRPLNGLKRLIRLCNARHRSPDGPPVFVVAVDVPSGLSDEGPLPGAGELVLHADLTVTFHSLKKAHLAAPEFCGEVVVHDIGL